MRYTNPIIMATTPFQRLPPVLANTATIPMIIRNNPARATSNPATKLNRLGFRMNPRPSTRAMIPSTISRSPRPLLTSLSLKPASINPIPMNATPSPVRTAMGINPSRGKANTIKPKIISTMAKVFLSIFFPPFVFKLPYLLCSMLGLSIIFFLIT